MAAAIGPKLPRYWTLLVVAPHNGHERTEGGVPNIESGYTDVGSTDSICTQPFSSIMRSTAKQQQDRFCTHNVLVDSASNNVEESFEVARRPKTGQRFSPRQQDINSNSKSITLQLHKSKSSTRDPSIYVQNTMDAESSSTTSSDINYLIQDEESSDDEEETEVVDMLPEILTLVRARSNEPRIPATLNEIAQFRMQLRQKLLDLYYGGKGYTPAIIAYEASRTGGRQTSMTAAIDTLCVTQLASSIRDEKLAHMSRRMYRSTMRRLNSDIRMYREQKDGRIRLDDIVGGIDGLIPCTWLASLATTNTEWIYHTNGLHDILRHCGLDAISASMKEACLFGWKRRAIMVSLRSRSKVKIGNTVTAQESREPCTLELTRLTYDVPHLLEQSDLLLRASRSRVTKKEHMFAILTQIGNFVAQLKRWQLDFTSQFPSRYRTVSIGAFEHFRPLCKETSGTFTSALYFANVAYERDYRLSVVCLLKLQRTASNIYRTFGTIWKGAEAEAQLQIHYRASMADAAICADTLSMIVPWMTLPHNTVFGSVYALHSLYDAAEFYAECGDGKKKQLAWCREVSSGLKRLHGIDKRYGAA